ncbi:MAG: ornithine cyclodeaminase family protein [Actinomycetota bacterium]|nr:ornithine cyclodeaminase family protein [Actinomycetota bacterium]
MGDVTVLVEADLRDLIGLGADELAAIDAVYPIVSRGEGSMPPIMSLDVAAHHGEVDVKAAYLPGYDGIAVKVSAGFFDNPSRGLPSLGGLMIVLDATTGVPAAALFDNGYLTDLRTALAGAVAARHLARPDASVVGVVGAGLQARLQLEALRLVRPVTSVRVWARRPDAAAGYAAWAAEDLGVDAVAVSTPADVVTAGGIVVTTTPATEPLLDETSLRPGVHVTAIGADAPGKRELSTGLLRAADRVVVDRRNQSLTLGELRAAVADGFDVAAAIELGEVIAGTAPGRTGPDDVTVCDLTGTGAQDTAIAALAVSRARQVGRGTVIAT